MAFLILYVTHADEASARALSQHLLEQKLIACANIFPIQSAYWWQGAVENAQEWVSLLKTSVDMGERTEAVILALHAYDTPCVMRWEVRANESYERWIQESVTGK
jgi:periplasmic divalent cation tolerance protein